MTATDSGPRSGHSAELVPFTFDLTAHEVRRLGAALGAITKWDPATVLAAETEAYSLLYSGLDVEQRAVYDLLWEEGVLDARPCPACHHRWWHDTEFGIGDYLPDRSRLPDFPASPGEAA